eukprot:6849873-Prorocentrum_lima.AAC.1
MKRKRHRKKGIADKKLAWQQLSLVGEWQPTKRAGIWRWQPLDAQDAQISSINSNIQGTSGGGVP